MLQDGNYDVLEFFPPTQGMNCNIASELLTKDFAPIMENFLPVPLGKATMRYGTKSLTMTGNVFNNEVSILEAFPYTTTNGNKQLLLYVQAFGVDRTANNFTITAVDTFTFTSTNHNNYIVDTPIKFHFAAIGYSGVTIYPNITNVVIAGNNVTITIDDPVFPYPAVNTFTRADIYYSGADIHSYDLQTSVVSGHLTPNPLAVGCIPRSTTFLNKLLICNGVDPVLTWDGTTLNELLCWIKESAAVNFTRTNDTTFTFDLDPDKAELFNIGEYNGIGNLWVANQNIKLVINGVTTVLNFDRIAIVGNTVTVFIKNGVLPAFDSPPELYYPKRPPAFSYMTSVYGRIFALGVGAASVKYRDSAEALKVYYAYEKSSLDLFNENTKKVPFLDLTFNHGIPDNLEAIKVIAGNTAFIGRHRTQIWAGMEPAGNAIIDERQPLLTFSHSLDVGVVNGNLLIDMPNDLYFVSQNGIQSFSTLNIARQFAASTVDAVNPLVRQYVKSLDISNVDFRACRTFKYNYGAFCGFKIGRNKILASMFSTNLYAWTVLSGDFFKAQTFVSDLDSSLYLVIDNNIMVYGDETTVTPIFGDNNGKDMIFGLLTLPDIYFKGKKFANKRYELRCDYYSSFNIDPRNSLEIMINGDFSKTFRLEDVYAMANKGDALGTVPFIDPGNIGVNPDRPKAGQLGFRLDEPYTFYKRRLKFLSQSFSLGIIASTINSKLSINRIRLYGILERRG